MLDFFLSYLLIYTYLIIFLVCFFSSLIFPLPATALLIASWAFVTQWYLNFSYILIFSFLWCVIGDISWYLISYNYWKKILNKLGFNRLLNSSRFEWLEKYFKKNSIKTILFSRFLLTWLCSSVNILSWLTKIKYKEFLFLDIIWEIIYVISFTYLGFYLWDQWEFIAQFLENFLDIIALIIILTILSKFLFFHKKF